MYMSKETFMAIIKKHDITICGSADIEDAFCFIRDILEAEADALEKSEPYATRSVRDYRDAARTIDIDLDMDAFCDLYNDIYR